jgi:hypothetical protein
MRADFSPLLREDELNQFVEMSGNSGDFLEFETFSLIHHLRQNMTKGVGADVTLPFLLSKRANISGTGWLMAITAISGPFDDVGDLISGENVRSFANLLLIVGSGYCWFCSWYSSFIGGMPKPMGGD